MAQQNEMKELLVGLTRVETKIDALGNVRELALEANESTKSAHKRLDKIEDNQKWLWRTVAGTFIVIVINAFVNLIKSGGM